MHTLHETECTFSLKQRNRHSKKQRERESKRERVGRENA